MTSGNILNRAYVSVAGFFTRAKYLLLPALVSLALLPAGASALPPDIERVSVNSAGIEGNFESTNSAISADARWVAFESHATNLDPDDTGAISDIFVRDLTTQTTNLISQGPGAPGPASNGHSAWPSISADGKRIAFESLATNLDAEDTDVISDIYTRDQCCGGTGITDLASRATGVSGAKGNGASTQSDISGDGSVVAFQSTSSNLDPADLDTITDIFVRDLTFSETELISRATGAAGAASNGSSADASTDADGNLVAFESTATNLDPADTDATPDVYVRDRETDITVLVSRASGVSGAKANGASSNGTISADGRYVAFQSNANNLHPDDPDTSADVYIRDLVLNTTSLVSRAGDGGATNGVSIDAVISYDGRYVTFDSNATNIVPNDTNAISDVFVTDTLLGYTVRVSLDYNGHEVLGGNPTRPAIANAARAVIFYSTGTYVPDDSNFVSDVMVVRPDTDGDLVLEPHDNCSGLPNGTQDDLDGDGAGDACDDDDDGDGLADAADGCPLAPEDADQFADSDGCPDPDNDLDGICDIGQAAPGCAGSDSGKYCFDPAGTLACPVLDCSNIAEDLDAFKDGDGCPEPDNDNDGFPDTIDDCPGADSRTGPDGMLGSPQDLNHNGVRDGAEATLTTDDVMPGLVWEDNDGVLDTDGCHDSPGDDFDGDGLTDDSEVFTHLTDAGHPDTDADGVIDGPDNCRLWPNPSQALPNWSVPANDSDCDRITNAIEIYLGTDPTRQCAADTTANNEGPPDRWPFDMNDNRIANTIDVGVYVFTLNESNPNHPGPNTNPSFNIRHDLNANGIINTIDVGAYVFVLNKTCSPSGP